MPDQALLDNPVVQRALRLVRLDVDVAVPTATCDDCTAPMSAADARTRFCDDCARRRKTESKRRWWAENGSQWRRTRLAATG